MIYKVILPLIAAVILTSCDAGDQTRSRNTTGTLSTAHTGARINASPGDETNIEIAAVATPGLAGARRLIDAIYAPYVRDAINSDPSRSFTPELTAAIRMAGDTAMNADPFCDCQDFGQFSYTIASLEPVEGGATARVNISSFGEAKTIVIHLLMQRGTWMVSDVGEGDNSLTEMMGRP